MRKKINQTENEGLPTPTWLNFAKIAESICGPGARSMVDVAKIAEKHKVEPLPNGYIVLDDADLWVRFAILEFVTEYDSEDGRRVTEATCLFYGEGPSGNLRECRHTYWGDDSGYIFYPSGLLITAAFRRLSDFFDDMV